MNKIKFAARRTNVTIPDGFGLKEKKIRPSMSQVLEANGNFTVSL
jgi:hypothetical protein